MSEHKVGDKVRILAGEKAGRIGTVEGIYKDRSAIDHYQINLGDELLFFDVIEIDSVSDHMTADELAELIASTPTERQDAAKLDEESDHIAKMMVEATEYNERLDKGVKMNNIITEDDWKKPIPKSTTKTAQYYMPRTPERELTTYQLYLTLVGYIVENGDNKDVEAILTELYRRTKKGDNYES